MFLQNFFVFNVYLLIHFLRIKNPKLTMKKLFIFFISNFFYRLISMINFQIIKKGKNVWKIFLSVHFVINFFLKIKYFSIRF